MNRIVLDATLRAKLPAAPGGVEFVDEQGNVLGHFLSQTAYEQLVARLFPPVTDERVAAARRDVLQNGGVAGEDLLARLERVTGPAGDRP